jgi:hypothetical protein
MRESYPPIADGSSPAPPELPQPPPAKFQFSLKHLLAFMLASAVMAAAVRYVVQFLQRLPDQATLGLFSTVSMGLVLGALLYFFFRAPFLVLHISRLRRRWKTVRAHRRALEQWSRQRIQERGRQPSVGKTPVETTPESR